VRRPIHRIVGLPVAVIIARNGNISVPAPLSSQISSGIGAGNPVPRPGGRAKYGYIRFPVAIIIGGHRDIAAAAPLLDDVSARIAAQDHEPHTEGGSIHSE